MKHSAIAPRLRPRRLSTRLVAPFVVLVVFLAVVGTWYLTRQAVGSMQERRLGQLADALRREQVIVGDAETESLNLVRRLAFTKGLADAVAARDADAVAAVVAGNVAASSVGHVSVVVAGPGPGGGPGGETVLVDLDRSRGPDPAAWRGDAAAIAEVQAGYARFAGLPAVVAGTPGAADDKDAALVPSGPDLPAALVVAGSIRAVDADGVEHSVGAVVVSTPLADLVAASRAQLGLDTAILAPGGAVLASTFGGDGGPFATADGPDAPASGGQELARSVEWSGGGYTVATAPLRLRGADAAIVAATLPDAPVAKSITATRLQILLLFAGGLAGVLLIGFGVSRRLARDIDALAGAADAVAGGDFDRRVPVRSRDELGRLATGFNEMAARLDDYRAEQDGVIEALHEADRAKDEFIDNLSHELRTPLTPIKGSARLLARDDLDAETRVQMADLISTNSDRLLEAVNRLISMSSKAQRGAPRAESVDLVALVDEVVTGRLAADQRDRVARARPALELPRAHVEAAPVRQIVYDLLDNALKFSDAGVDVSFRAAVGQVAIEIADRGPGVPEAERERVFERFYQVDGSSTRRHGGLGLGLAVAADLAGWLGGAVGLTSRQGGGTVATVSLPEAPAEEGNRSLGLAVQRVPAQPR